MAGPADAREHGIAAIIRRVRALIPTVVIVQQRKTHPADDDGLWWFRLPGSASDIQIESSSGDCPFLVETDGHQDPAARPHAHTVDEATGLIVSYLQRLAHEA